MENIALIGIDLGKNSFHIHCQDRRGKAVYRKKFTRPKLIEFLATCPATTIAMEAGTVAKLAMRQPFVLFKGL
ncbi:IS110 family transposase, partial [Klebsiella quasipneumoniae]